MCGAKLSLVKLVYSSVDERSIDVRSCTLLVWHLVRDSSYGLKATTLLVLLRHASFCFKDPPRCVCDADFLSFIRGFSLVMQTSFLLDRLVGSCRLVSLVCQGQLTFKIVYLGRVAETLTGQFSCRFTALAVLVVRYACLNV